MRRCICTHREDDHHADGACRAVGCECARFTPIPEVPPSCLDACAERRLPAPAPPGSDRVVTAGWVPEEAPRDTWALGNRLMCDFLHRGRLPVEAMLPRR